MSDDWNVNDPEAPKVFYDLGSWTIDQQADLAAEFADRTVIVAALKAAEQRAAVRIFERAVRLMAGAEDAVERFQFEAVDQCAALDDGGGVSARMHVARFDRAERVFDDRHAQAVFKVVVVHRKAALAAVEAHALLPRRVGNTYDLESGQLDHG